MDGTELPEAEVSKVNALDGVTSIRRAYTAAEMRRIVDAALRDAGRPVVKLKQTVAPLWIRQVVEITWIP